MWRYDMPRFGNCFECGLFPGPEVPLALLAAATWLTAEAGHWAEKGLARLGLWGLVLGLAAAPSAVSAAPPFAVGEEVTYRITWGMVPIAESTITTEWVREGAQDLIRIRLRTRTNKFMDKIHRVDDLVECIVDPALRGSTPGWRWGPCTSC
jgi:hypothetical protein